MMYKLKDWLYRTWIGEVYLNLVLWYALNFNKTSTKYLTPKEMAQIIRESQKIADGTGVLKKNINTLVTSRTKVEYQKVLTQIQDLLVMSKYDDDSSEAKFAEVARQMYVKKGNMDVVTSLDRVKMIDQRINDIYALQDHKARRELMRTIRKLRVDGKLEEADKLQKEWYNKYGRMTNGSTK